MRSTRNTRACSSRAATLATFHAELATVSASRKLERESPAASEVERWIEETKALPARVEH